MSRVAKKYQREPKELPKVEVMNEVAEITVNKSNGWLKYGNDDKLPNTLVRAVADSATATSCAAKMAAFIEANGFIDEAANTFPVNSKQTASELLADIAPSEALFEGHALKVKMNVSGEVASAEVIPIKSLRRLSDGSWRYNPLMGEKNYDKANDVLMPDFNPKWTQNQRAQQLAEQLKDNKGQIGFIFCSFQKTLQQYGDVLPIPQCWSGLEDIQTDAALQRLDRRNVKKGFKADVVVKMPGQVDSQTKDEETGLTAADVLDNTLREFAGEEGAPVMLLESNVAGVMPEVDVFQYSDILNGTAQSRDRIPKAVCRTMGVPPVLIGLEVPSILGSDKAVLNSLKMFLFTVKNRQRRIERTFKALFPNMDWALSSVNPYDYLPPEVLAKLTTDELRALGGYQKLDTPIDSNTKTLAEVIGVGGLTALQAILVDTTLTPEQKQNICMVVFGISQDDALKLAPNGTT